jgi:hypothetical protein
MLMNMSSPLVASLDHLVCMRRFHSATAAFAMAAAGRSAPVLADAPPLQKIDEQQQSK